MSAYALKSVGNTVGVADLGIGSAGKRAAVSALGVSPSNVRFRGEYSQVGYFNITGTIVYVSVLPLNVFYAR